KWDQSGLTLVSFVIASRTREMGVRMALGATPESLGTLMIRQALLPVAVGLAGGILGTRLISPLAEEQLFKVDYE
ncbi:MAG: FtsX-like permease family protein, partial [bacterium]